MKTAEQYIEEIKMAFDNNDPVKAIDIFQDVSDMVEQTGKVTLLMEVHKECAAQIVGAMNSPEFREEMKRLEQKREKARREEEDRIGVWRLSRWPELRNAGILEEGDLVQISIEDMCNYMMTMKEMAMHVNAIWEGTFTKKRNGEFELEYSHTGLIFFEGGAMCIERGTDEPIPIFGDSPRKFKHCTIKVISKAA